MLFPFDCKADIRNPLSLLAHERSRFATCQWELLTPTDISIPLTHRLVLYALEAGECLFCVQELLAKGRLGTADNKGTHGNRKAMAGLP